MSVQSGGPAVAARISIPRFPPPMQHGDGQGPSQHRPRPGYQPYKLYPRPPVVGGGGASGPVDPHGSGTEYDGRRLRKSLVRKTVDYNAAIIKGLQNRVWQRDHRDRRMLQPDYSYAPDTVPPSMLLDNPTNAVTTRYVKSATNKMRCPIFAMTWTPEGRRLITGASSGEFTLWNGLTFNFETILQAHDSPVRSMVWSHNDLWMVTGDHGGYVKYWQSNMNNVKMFQAHKEAIRGLSFSPSDYKFASCSDDGTVRVWDFYTCYEEKVLRGHGADVKCVDWHPHKAIIVSGSKDNQQPIKIWDPKSGTPLATLHAHKSTVMDCKWNQNGNWLVTASRDHLVKLFDIRKLNQEMQIFRGHKKEASCVSWHPIHETMFASGGSDGSIMFWDVGCDKEVGSIEAAHDNIIWALAWHPVGHILCSGSNDHTSKFWTRQKPGDIIRDRTHGGAFHDSYNPDENEMEEIIPGMGPEDKIDVADDEQKDAAEMMIPGLDITEAENSTKTDKQASKKIPYQKPIPKKFQAIWNDNKLDDELEDDKDRGRGTLLPKPSNQGGPPGPGPMNQNPGFFGMRPDGPPPRMGRPSMDPFNPFVGFGPMGTQYNEPGFGGPPGPNPFWQPPPPLMSLSGNRMQGPPGGPGPGMGMGPGPGRDNMRMPPMNRMMGPRQFDPRDRRGGWNR